MLRLLSILMLVVQLAAMAGSAAAAERPPLILVSIDGFRPDYLDRGITPHLSALAAGGARGAMRPSFPSKTFPNHYALVTGLRPDRNGIVENTMEDPKLPRVTFRMSNREAVQDRRWWDDAEPIWVTAEKAGIPTAPVFWPGSEAPVRGVRPRHFLRFDMATPEAVRVDRLLALLDQPGADRPGFLTLYFDTVDTAGHHHGPDAAETNAAVAAVDAQIGRLVAGLQARGLATNLVVVSDHGMAATSPERRVFMDDYLPKSAYRSLSGGAFMTIYPARGREADVRRRIVGRHPHFECWPKNRIPARFAYGAHRRVAPIFCLAQTGWALTTRDYRPAQPELGNHGFDPFDPAMRAVFVAHGPAFRRGAVLADFDNVDVYPLLAHLLGVPARPGDGAVRALQPALVR